MFLPAITYTVIWYGVTPKWWMESVPFLATQGLAFIQKQYMSLMETNSFLLALPIKESPECSAVSDILMKVFWLLAVPKSTLCFLAWKKGRVKERCVFFFARLGVLLTDNPFCRTGQDRGTVPLFLRLWLLWLSRHLTHGIILDRVTFSPF